MCSFKCCALAPYPHGHAFDGISHKPYRFLYRGRSQAVRDDIAVVRGVDSAIAAQYFAVRAALRAEIMAVDHAPVNATELGIHHVRWSPSRQQRKPIVRRTNDASQTPLALARAA